MRRLASFIYIKKKKKDNLHLGIWCMGGQREKGVGMHAWCTKGNYHGSYFYCTICTRFYGKDGRLAMYV
jgi:hypothetical protein